MLYIFQVFELFFFFHFMLTYVIFFCRSSIETWLPFSVKYQRTSDMQFGRGANRSFQMLILPPEPSEATRKNKKIKQNKPKKKAMVITSEDNWLISFKKRGRNDQHNTDAAVRKMDRTNNLRKQKKIITWKSQLMH